MRIVVERLLPLRGRQLQAVGLLIDFAQMVMYGWIAAVTGERFGEVFFRECIVAKLKVDPAERIEISVLLWVELDGLFDHGQRFVQLYTTVGQHITQIVEGDGRVWL